MRKNILKTFSLIVATTFIFGMIFSVNLSFAEDSPEVKRTEELILTSHILSAEETVELAGLLTQIKQGTSEISILRRISLEVTKKVVDDRANLQFLLTDLDRLANDKYSAKLGKIKSSQLKSCWSKIKKLSLDMEKMRPKFNKSDKALDSADYLKIMDSNSIFLTPGKKVASILSVWNLIEKQIEKPFSLWEDKYQQLLLKSRSQEGKEPEEILEEAEIKFVKTFGRVLVYYHKLSGRLGELN